MGVDAAGVALSTHPEVKGRGRESLRSIHARMRRVVGKIARCDGLDPAAMTKLAGRLHDPYEILVGTIISLRTRDEVTVVSARRLLAIAPDLASLERLDAIKIEKAIYPAGFYHTKARTLREISRILRERHGGKVPGTMDELLALPGVGRKTANLVLLLGFGIPALCVDTHVHRISNRLGFVVSRNPTETEMALRERLPASLWWTYNELLVSFGKSVCTPLSPHCSTCPVRDECPRIGVERSR
jgi:endonuclease-3